MLDDKNKLDGLHRLARYIIENYDFSYFDDAWGALHVHAGIPVDSKGDPLYTVHEIMQLQVRWQQVRQSGNPQEIISFLRGVKPFLELGEDQWINKEKVDSFMAKLGVNFIVVGHEFHAVRYNKRVLNVGGGIWGIDMADVDHQKGYPGHLVMSPKEGIYFKPLLGDVEPEFSKSGLIAHLRQRISVLQDLEDSRAMIGRDVPTGGIDLNANKEALQIKHSAEGSIEFKSDAAMLKEIELSPGLHVNIIDMRPINNVREFLGLS